MWLPLHKCHTGIAAEFHTGKSATMACSPAEKISAGVPGENNYPSLVHRKMQF